MLVNQFKLPESVWQFIEKTSSESECHCTCGKTFISLAYYIGKKTGSVTRLCCPSCGATQMDYILPYPTPSKIPNLTFISEVKRKKFRATRLDTSKEQKNVV